MRLPPSLHANLPLPAALVTASLGPRREALIPTVRMGLSSVMTVHLLPATQRPLPPNPAGTAVPAPDRAATDILL